MSLPEAAAPSSWPLVGTWIIATASAHTDWRVAATALTNTTEVRVVIVVLGPPPDDDEPTRKLRARADAYLQLGKPGNRANVASRIRSLTRPHSLILVAAPAGFLAPLGVDGWTLAELAVELPASAAVIAEPGEDPAADTTHALAALAAHGVTAEVVALGDLDEDALPVHPAGRIHPEQPKPADTTATSNPVLTPSRARWATRLVAVVATVLVVGGGFTWWRLGVGHSGGSAPDATRKLTPHQDTSRLWSEESPQLSGVLCPQFAGPVMPTQPDASTSARVDAAWTRIEGWLAVHAAAAGRALQPGATATQLDDLQRRMSVTFPADLVATLRRHDGVTGTSFTFPSSYAPESLARIAADWTVNCGALINDTLIPFAAGPTGARLLATTTRLAEFKVTTGITNGRWPHSITELLEQTATSLETSLPYAATVGTDGSLKWPSG